MIKCDEKLKYDGGDHAQRGAQLTAHRAQGRGFSA